MNRAMVLMFATFGGLVVFGVGWYLWNRRVIKSDEEILRDRYRQEDR